MNREIEAVDLIDTPEGRDEVGVPEDLMGRCPDCDAALPLEHGYRHRCEDGEDRYYDAVAEEFGTEEPPAATQEVPADV